VAAILRAAHAAGGSVVPWGGRTGLVDGTSAEDQIAVSDEVMPSVISLPHGWGHALPGIRLEIANQRPGANLKALLDENLRDPLSGNAVLSGVPVRLEPEAPEQDRIQR
jgi:hypothetical protein